MTLAARTGQPQSLRPGAATVSAAAAQQLDLAGKGGFCSSPFGHGAVRRAGPCRRYVLQVRRPQMTALPGGEAGCWHDRRHADLV